MPTPLVHAEDEAPSNGRRPRRRKRILLGLLVLGVVAVGAIGVVAYSATTFAPAAEKPAPPPVTPVVRGNLVGTSLAPGTLAYANPRPLTAALSGIVTALSAPATVIGQGQVLYSVDDQPVTLFRGALPAWRPFSSGMSDGPDVKQLEENLQTLGYFDGDPDTEFTWWTKYAIQLWQEATGQQDTGTIELGRVMFATGDVRISKLDVLPGAQVGAGTEVGTVTDTGQIVIANIKLGDQKLAVVDAVVTIQLPDGKSSKGKVVAVGTPVEQDDKTMRIPVTVTLDDSAASGGLQEASVTVVFTSETRENVLYVPANALLALPGDKFGVEVLDSDGTTHKVPVELGLFAGGNVEISGTGITEGDDVVVPGS